MTECDIRDPGLAAQGADRVDRALQEMPVLRGLMERGAAQRRYPGSWQAGTG
jgi:hypothetical protein